MTHLDVLKAVSCSEVFNHSDGLQDQYRALVKVCHPDTGGSTEAFQKLNEFYKEAQASEDAGFSLFGDTLRIKSIGFSSLHFKGIQSHHKFELGDIYVSDEQIIYIVDKGKAEMFSVSSYKSKSIEDAFKLLMPQQVFIKSPISVPGKEVLFFRKTPDQFLLADLLKLKWDAKHVAWFMSRLLDLGCFFKYNCQRIPFDVSPFSLLVSIEHHAVAFTDGLWFTFKDQEEIKLLPRRILDELPGKVRNYKVAEWSVYSSQVRAMCLELLGDRTGTKLRGKIQEPLFNWLLQPGSNHQQEEYETWQKSTLPSIFPVREFVKWPITTADVYRSIS